MATNNDFVSLDVPNGPGSGAPSDVSDMAPGLSLIVTGPASSTGEIVIEVSQDGASFAAFTAIFPISDPPAAQLGVVAKFVRVTRFSGSGPALVAIGAPKTTSNLFGTLTLAPLDTSEMGPKKTIVLSGDHKLPIVIEGSADGSNYDAVASFTTKGSDVITVEGTWATMRIRRDDIPAGVTVTIGAGFPASAGSGGGSGFKYLLRVVGGQNGAGSTVCEGARVGDIVQNQIIYVATNVPPIQDSVDFGTGPLFEGVITVDDRIQQTSGADLSGKSVTVFLERAL